MSAAGTVSFLHSEVVGVGRPCLVAHGGPGLHHGLYRSLDPLAAGSQLVYWDHRGHGRSGPLPDGPAMMAMFVDDAVVVADQLGINTFAVFGHSFGGWVAQELAIRHPHRVSALVLAATTPGQLGSSESPDDDQGPPPPADVAELMATQPATDADLIQLYSKLAPHFLRGADTAPFIAALDLELVSADSMRRVFAALGEWSVVDRLGDIACPTLVLAGQHDVFCSPQQLTRIARRITHADHVVFENSGHFTWLEEPARFLPLVVEWLNRNAR